MFNLESAQALQVVKVAYRLNSGMFIALGAHRCKAHNSTRPAWFSCTRPHGHQGPHVSWWSSKAWTTNEDVIDL
jgi:hypothetical protein